MSVSYTGIGWNRQKRLYDLWVGLGVVATVGAFVGAGTAAFPGAEQMSPVQLALRGLGVSAIVLLHVVLAIGPLCRLDRRFLPLLYNRRHLGVTTFLVALAHAALSTLWYHGFGNVNPALSLLSSNTRFDSLREFPFETLGIGALVILFLLAATSHDFWLKNLTPRVWKWLHMGVYGAYALIFMHVALGLLQSDPSPALAALLALGGGGLVVLHIAAGAKVAPRDRPVRAGSDGWVEVCRVEDLAESRACTVCVAGAGGGGTGEGRGAERIAVYRHAGGVSAINNVCRHQGGPLGEGKVVDGCVTCPWHGYQYLPASGSSPPPFDDKVSTYRVRISVGRVYVDPRPLPPGTPVEPARIDGVAPPAASPPSAPVPAPSHA